MQIKYFCPRWGHSHLPIPEFISKVKSAGFDGVEMTLSLNEQEKCLWRELLSQNDLLFIGQMVEAGEANDFNAHLLETEVYLKNLATLNPLKIDTFTGRDYFSFEQNCQLIERVFEIESDLGVQIVHEIHRGRFTYSIGAIRSYLAKYKNLRLNADFSHWCCVSESYLQEPALQELMSEVIGRCDHIHARVGYPEGPQVNDPRAPEWEEALDIHIAWWQQIINIHRAKDTKIFTITTEFGPVPYLQSEPFTKRPLADQWEINVWMMHTLKERLM